MNIKLLNDKAQETNGLPIDRSAVGFDATLRMDAYVGDIPGKGIDYEESGHRLNIHAFPSHVRATMLRPDGQNGGDEPDIFLERRLGSWVAVSHPANGADPIFECEFHDDGRIVVCDLRGIPCRNDTILEYEP